MAKITTSSPRFVSVAGPIVSASFWPRFGMLFHRLADGYQTDRMSMLKYAPSQAKMRMFSTIRHILGCRCRFQVAGFVALHAILAPGAAHAADPAAVVRLLAEQDAAVLRVGERLAVASAPFCGRAMRSSGMLLQRSDQYGADYRAAAFAVLGVTDQPTVTVVAPGGAAEKAGIRPMDIVLGIDGRDFPAVAPRRARGEFAGIAAIHDAVDAVMADGLAEVRVIRDGQPMTVVVYPRPGCRARFEVRAGRTNSASSDGLYVQISSDLVAQARGEGQLATVLAHELAHNILEHPQRRRASGSRPSVRSTEIAADRLSVYLLDAAGYPIADAVAFWSEWGRANDLGILSDRTHPGWRKRIASIEAEAALIAAAKAAGRPVTPPADLLR